MALDDAELASLRTRAYGPGADIARDPAAQARLTELEDQRRRRDAPTPHFVSDDAVVADDAVEPMPAGEPPVEQSVDAGPHKINRAAPAPASSARRRRSLAPAARRWLAIGAVGVVVAVAGAVVVADVATPDPDTVLSPSATPAKLTDEMQGFFANVSYHGIEADQMRLFDGFRGLQVWAGESRSGTQCIFVYRERIAVWGPACAPSGIEPVLDVTRFDSVEGADLFGDMPAGSVIRFILRGDQVDVWVAAVDSSTA